jgi:hypothetical protein
LAASYPKPDRSALRFSAEDVAGGETVKERDDRHAYRADLRGRHREELPIDRPAGEGIDVERLAERSSAADRPT